MRKIAIATLLMLALAGTAVAQDILINEVDADTDGTDILEFVELYGPPGASLDGLVLVFYNGSDWLAYTDGFDLDGYSLDANGFFLLGNTDVVPTPSIIFPSNGLQNGDDAVALLVGDGVDYPNDAALPAPEIILDAIVYDTNDGDDATLLAALTPGEPQINEGAGVNFSAFDSNQRCPDGAGGGQVTSFYYQFPPTPGASNNTACASVPNETGSWGQLKALFD